MDLSSINPILLLASLMVAATPLLLAAVGELVVEKAGVLNLGVEGMMITGAICGFAIAVNTGNPLLGVLAAAVGGAVLSLLFALLTQVALANQVASGLGLTLFGLGLSSLIGQGYQGIRPPSFPRLNIPGLSDLPVVGRIFFSHDLMVYLGLIIVTAVWFMLKYTRAGLILRAVGENHEAAHALGYKVVRIRIMAILFGGACAGHGWGLYQPDPRAPMDRGDDSRNWLDRPGAGGLCQLEALAGPAGCLSFWRRDRDSAESAGGRRCDSRRISGNVALSDHHPRAGHHVGRQEQCACLVGPYFPCLTLRPKP